MAGSSVEVKTTWLGSRFKVKTVWLGSRVKAKTTLMHTNVGLQKIQFSNSRRMTTLPSLLDSLTLGGICLWLSLVIMIPMYDATSSRTGWLAHSGRDNHVGNPV